MRRCRAPAVLAAAGGKHAVCTAHQQETGEAHDPPEKRLSVRDEVLALLHAEAAAADDAGSEVSAAYLT
jgi:hypothetical protein